MSEYNALTEKYKALVDAIKYLNSSMKTEEILKTLLIKSIELIENADTGLIFIYNDGKKSLEVKCSYGFDKLAYNIVILPGESITGKAFLQNKTIVVNGSQNVKEEMNDISFYKTLGKEADDYLGKSLNDIKGAIACPINIKDQCIGVLVVDNFKNDTDFNVLDIEILENISIQAALAIENARNYENEKKNNESLNQYSKILELERNKYKYTTQLHVKFTQMVLNGASINDLIFELSDIISSDIIYLDTFFNIVESTNKYSHDMDTIFKNIKIGCKKGNFSDINLGNLNYRFQPVLVEKEYFGWLVIIQNKKFSIEDEITIDRGITILAIEILKQRQINAVEEKYRGDFVDTLINNYKDISKYSTKYKLDFSKAKRLILLEFSENLKKSNIDNFIQYYSQSIDRTISNISEDYFLSRKLNTIIVLIPSDLISRERITIFLEELFGYQDSCNVLLDSDISMSGIVSESFVGGELFSSVYSNCKRILEKMCQGNELYKWSFYEDNKIKKILLNTKEDELKNYLYEILGPLIGNKKMHIDLMETLRVYVKSNRNWTYTKEQLYIHGNTLTHRLNRINQILNMDINDYYNYFQIQVALEIHDLFI